MYFQSFVGFCKRRLPLPPKTLHIPIVYMGKKHLPEFIFLILLC
jgi:hypothetical protein